MINHSNSTRKLFPLCVLYGESIVPAIVHCGIDTFDVDTQRLILFCLSV